MAPHLSSHWPSRQPVWWAYSSILEVQQGPETRAQVIELAEDTAGTGSQGTLLQSLLSIQSCLLPTLSNLFTLEVFSSPGSRQDRLQLQGEATLGAGWALRGGTSPRTWLSPRVALSSQGTQAEVCSQVGAESRLPPPCRGIPLRPTPRPQGETSFPPVSDQQELCKVTPRPSL